MRMGVISLMNPLVPTFPEAVLSFAPLALLLLAALAIITFYAIKLFRKARSKALPHGSRGKTASQNDHDLK
ncbi:hypothetical protein GCM10023346_39710 [Arthrobacter gyeryongensis]|uniref:Uncharacterized protein n=1 Tax=Arthrobacter gyeryongensis TaxID=1650592 RepID=A0ABP9SQZ7_9MICC